MLPKIEGKAAWVFTEDDFDIDQMIGVSNISVTDPETLKKVFLNDYDPDFINYVEPGDLIIGGKNFGYGHPHMGPKTAMKVLGMGGIIAESFAPVNYRVDQTFAFVDIVCPDVTKKVSRGDRLSFDWDTNILTNHTTGEEIPCEPVSQKRKNILECGGIVEYIRKYRLEK